MNSTPRELVGASGRRYQLMRLIQERPRLGSVWQAVSCGNKYILKDIPEAIFDNFNESIHPRMSSLPKLRLPLDTINDRRTFAYRYLTDDLLSLVKKREVAKSRRKILKECLEAVAAMHAHDIVHLDIKPDNILIDRGEGDAIGQVLLSDLENSAYLPRGRSIKGMLPGNERWRSPEGHFKGELNKPADIYSFGAVCVYAMIGRIIFDIDEDFRFHEKNGAIGTFIHLQRQVSFFGDREGLNGLMTHVGDEEINCQILGLLWDEKQAEHIPYRPFSEWPEVKDEDPAFKDVVQRMMNLDPSKRITASEALQHKWFAQI